MNLRELIERHPIDVNDVDNFLLLSEEGIIVDDRFGEWLAGWVSYRDCVDDIMAELSRDYLRQTFGDLNPRETLHPCH